MKVSFFSIFLSLTILAISCGGNTTGPKMDLKGYQVEQIGGGATAASYFDANSWPLSKGHLINGVQNGQWTTFHPDSRKMKTITNYINGKKNGAEVTFNERGQIIEIKHFQNDQLHGLSATYRSSRPVKETIYTKGVMHGPFAIYDEFTGKIQRSGTYSNGQFHGDLYFYGSNEEVTLKYVYDQGEKVSGGIVD